MSFDDILDQATEDIFSVAGVDATFVPASGFPVACRVFVSDEAAIQPGGFEMGALSQVRNIEARLSELGTTPAEGDSFIVPKGPYSGTWKVGEELENDGISVKVAIL